MTAKNGVDFTKGNLTKHVRVMSITSSIGILAIYVVDLLDLLFISMLGHNEMAAAAGIAGTLLFFVSTINIGLSIATGTLVGRALGKGDREQAREVTGTAIVVSTAVGIVVPFLMIPNLHWLLGLIGATDELADLAYGYTIVLLPATFISGISMNLVNYLRADGAAGRAMYPSLCGALVNLVFDPIFILGLGLGLPGAAAATVMARIATLAVALYPFRGEIREFLLPDLKAIRTHISEIGSYALYSALGSVAAPIGQAIAMRHFASFGQEALVGISIIGRLAPVVFSVINALSGAIGPIMAQNYGANEMGRVREAYFAAAKFLAQYVAVVALLLFLLRSQIVWLFSATGTAQELLYLYCGPFAIIAFFNGVIAISGGALNSLGRPTYEMGFSWVKNTVGLLPFLTAGSYLYGLWGLAFGLLLHTAVFACISVQLAKRVYLDKVATPLGPATGDWQTERRAHNQGPNGRSGRIAGNRNDAGWQLDARFGLSRRFFADAF